MSNTDALVGMILLAAGKSERFGGDKRLASIALPESAQPQPMLFVTLQQICVSGLPVFVVLRPGDQQWGEALDKLSIDWGICPEAGLGMGHSLAFGVHATQHWNGWLIALADMPFIQPATYQRVAEALNQHNIVRPVLQRTGTDAGKTLNGHPVGFSRNYACSLIQCQGDEGARRLLADNPQDIYLLPSEDEGIWQDIDRPEDCQGMGRS